MSGGFFGFFERELNGVKSLAMVNQVTKNSGFKSEETAKNKTAEFHAVSKGINKSLPFTYYFDCFADAVQYQNSVCKQLKSKV